MAVGRNLDLKQVRHIDYDWPHLKLDYTLSYEERRSLCGDPKAGKARLSNVRLMMLHKLDIEADALVDSLDSIRELL